MAAGRSAYEVLVDARIEKDLAKAPDQVVQRLLRTLDRLAEDPLTPRAGLDVKPMRGHRGVHRLRIGAWRILYTVDRKRRQVRLTLAAPRGTAYR